MKRILCVLLIACSLFGLVGCSSDSDVWVRYPHEYTGIVEFRVANKRHPVYYVNCTPKGNTSVFGELHIDSYDVHGENIEFKSFMMQNLGKIVKIKVNVITREGNDHDASYGSFEIVEWEVVE